MVHFHMSVPLSFDPLRTETNQPMYAASALAGDTTAISPTRRTESANSEQTLPATDLVMMPPPSGSFPARSVLSGVCAAQPGVSALLDVVPKVGCATVRSAGRCVALDVEQLGQAALGRAHVGEHAAGAGAAFAAVVVEQHGLFDAAQGGQQLAHREVQSGALGFAAHQ